MEPAKTPTWAIVAGGGTAGHVLPGLAICRELVRRGLDPEAVHYVGSERGIEQRLVPEAGFSLTVLPGRGIQRKLTTDNIAATRGLLSAIWQARALVKSRQPAMVVGLGGYASVPCGLAAVALGVPLVLAEQNAVPGVANKMLSLRAKAAAVSFPNTGLRNEVWTGNPVRPEVLAVDRRTQRESARARLGVGDDRTFVVVFGGSLGARRINNATIEAVEQWRDRADLSVRHVAGERDFDALEARNSITEDDAIDYELIRYENDMPSLYAAADVVLCRSGASSVAELAAVGLASVLVPLPGAPGDHQTANARALADVGAAVLVPDDELDAARVQRELAGLLDDPARLETMGQAGRAVAKRDAAAAVVDLIVRHGARPLGPLTES